MSSRLTPRTLLFVPGDRLDKAAAAGADGAIIDLEDPVPAQHTEQARAATAACLARASAWVRVNPCGTDDFLVDVDRARQHQVLPGSSSPRPSEPRIWTDRHQGNTPTLIDPQLVRNVDVVVTLGREARVNPMPGTRFENWDTDEPSDRGIGGMERMRLVRDDIADRVADLLTRMVVDQRGCGPIIPPGLIIGPIIAGMPSLTKP